MNIMFGEIIRLPGFAEAWDIVKNEFLFAAWETFYVTVISALFAIIIGLPLGIILIVGEEKGIAPLPGFIMRALNLIINILRSIPFLMLMVLIIPLTRAIVGTSVGTVASIVPLVVASFPFVARLAESSIRELDKNIVETALSMGATPFQAITRVMIPESLPSLISNFTVAITTILGYSAMSGIIGGGGLGKIAMNYGYYRYMYLVMILAIVLLVVIVQIFQNVGTYFAIKLDKRIK